MYSQTDIEEAVAAGALAPEQAANLRDFVAVRNGAPTADEEYARIVFGFNDIFVSYACLFALLALGMLGAQVGGPRGLLGLPALPLLVAGLLVAAASWGLSELFLRRERHALPGILLPLTLAFGIALGWFGLVLLVFGSSTPDPVGGGLLLTLGAALAAFLAWLHWRRFRMPFANMVFVAMVVLSVMLLILSLLAKAGAIGSVMSIILLVAGLATFAYAMSWDMRDPLRGARASEVGMWQHWLAAALITYGLLGLFGISQGVASVGGAIGMIVIYLVFALVALVVNRRQLLIFGLTPLATALTSLIRGGSGGGYRGRSLRGFDMDAGIGYPPSVQRPYRGDMDAFGSSFGSHSMADMLLTSTITLLILAAILLLLAIFWQPIRRGVLAMVPAGLRARLPGTRIAGVPAPLEVE